MSLVFKKKETDRIILQRKYQLRERGSTIYASADDKVSHMSRAGDVDSGKAWRTVRRPSDMVSFYLRYQAHVVLTFCFLE